MQVPSNLDGLWAEPTPRIALRGEGAPEHVKQVADETTGTVWGDGAAHALHPAASWMTDSARCNAQGEAGTGWNA
ncbi:hypothetical protein [Promicromonospora soli]